jgi:hypothetical protein
LKFVAHRCTANSEAPGCNTDEPVLPECPPSTRKWSDPMSWDPTEEVEARTGFAIPEEGDVVEIPGTWNMELDLGETPIIDTLIINGCLHFKQGKAGEDIHLRAKKILVRGELYIGTVDKPFNNVAKITLHGERNEPTIVVQDQTIEAGNKIIANVGRLNMYGKQRSFKMTRLTEPATIGSTSIKIETKNVDLVEGDRIMIAPTGV